MEEPTHLFYSFFYGLKFIFIIIFLYYYYYYFKYLFLNRLPKTRPSYLCI